MADPIDPTLALLQAQAATAPAQAAAPPVDPTLALLQARARSQDQDAPAPNTDTPWYDKAIDGTNRQLQVVGRAGAQGLQGLATLPATAGSAAGWLGIKGYNAATSSNVPTDGLYWPTQEFSNMLDSAGMATNQSKPEQLESDVVSALSGAKTLQNAGQVLGGKVGAVMQANPGSQNASAIGGALAGGAARENGASPMATAVYSLLGGLGGGGIYNTAKAATLPLTAAGKTQIIGSLLREQANDPAAAESNLSAVPQYVPDSNPTAGIASKDYGLMGTEKWARANIPGQFGDAISLQNAARNNYLDTLAGGDVQAMKDARDAATSPMRDAAFANSQPVDIGPVRQQLAAILAAPEGKRTAVENAVNWVGSRLGRLDDQAGQQSASPILGANGQSVSQPAASSLANPADLYEVRKDVGELMRGKLDVGDKPSYALAQGQLSGVQKGIDNVIESGAPGYKNYLDTYRQASVPINQQEAAQGIRGAITTTNVDPTTQTPFLSQPPLTGILQKGTVKTDMGTQALADALAPNQLSGFQNLGSDLERANSLNSQAIRMPGSDTFSNLATGNNIATKVAAKTPFIGKFMGYGDANDAIKQQLAEALLTPQKTLGAMQAARQAQQNSLTYALRNLVARP